ncbi:alanine racemase, partial [Mesorhizobium sp. M7A.F.Ca.US.003.02.2.1]
RRSPPMARVEEVVRTVDISLQSELATIREISRIAERMGRVHDIMLMIDLGDLREGIWPNDLIPTVEQILQFKGVRIAGIGTNLGCFGAIMPTPENLGQLVAHAYKTERLSGKSLDVISGGASSSLPLLLEGRLPAGINNLRVGEAILQGGVETFRDVPWAELEPDACRLTSDIIEVKLKPSRPIGQSGYDAFGNQPVFPDEGDRLRAIANIGREDVLVEGLTPIARG